MNTSTTTSALNKECLILNADYTPSKIVSCKKAIQWVYKFRHIDNYAIDIIEYYDGVFLQRSNGEKEPVPAVAKTRRYFRPNSNRLQFNRKNIFLRDDYTCQYCGEQLPFNQLTYDHVIPRSVWNQASSCTCWTNIVTSCKPCNSKKANRTPKQAGMKLLNFPEKPTKTSKFLPLISHLNKIKHRIPEEWKPYLPESYYA